MTLGFVAGVIAVALVAYLIGVMVGSSGWDRWP